MLFGSLTSFTHIEFLYIQKGTICQLIAHLCPTRLIPGYLIEQCPVG